MEIPNTIPIHRQGRIAVRWVFHLLFPLFLISLSACEFLSPKWVSLGTPPSGAEQIEMLIGNTIWVQTKNSGIFTAIASPGCDSAPLCSPWSQATEIPTGFAWGRQSWHGPDCSTLNPDSPVANPPGTVKDCGYVIVLAGETDWRYYFALMSDGSVMFLDANPPYAGIWIFTGP